MNIRPIETHYAGYRFRSRIEARWAVFFDHLGITWEYEPEGYLIDGKPYLPDFLVYPNTDLEFWLEIKGTFPSDEEIEKAQGLAEGTGIRAFVYFTKLEVPAPEMSQITTMSEYMDGPGKWVWDNQEGWLNIGGGPPQWQVGLKPTAFLLGSNPGFARKPRSDSWWWTDCWFCGRVILKLYGQIGVCPQHHVGDWVDEGLYPRFAHRTPRLLEAYRAARSARFEHGEKG
ncbi:MULTISPECIES: hypothetical protein [unclassified Nocardiopsis]|uniref:hypothetical protein n=1 Tax=unclassified Nocardiopsis TaxID=2649073 RepID=UPI00135981A2|nr:MULTISPECIES: hypothetical protein [unclassified Nocardiopsis]